MTTIKIKTQKNVAETPKASNSKPLTTKKDAHNDQEKSLADELQLISLLKDRPDFLLKHPQLLTQLTIPHSTNGAVSLIERQVELLRDKLKKTERRMGELMDNAHANERLAQSRHRIAVNLLGAHDLDDVISTVLDELGNELKAEFAVIKLITSEQTLIAERADLFIIKQGLAAFSTMMKHKNPVCGRSTDEQKQFLFGDAAEQVKSAAIIPLVAGADLGLLGLGGSDENRFHSTMGTEFLRQMGELISAALAVHMESQ